MHNSRRLKKGIIRQGIHGKAIELGMIQRDGNVRATVVPDRKKPIMQEHVSGNVDVGSVIFSDEQAHAWRMDDKYKHEVVNHAEAYVEGNVHTNGLENFWSLLKRGLHGTYISVEPFHLFRYIDELAYRFNNRKLTDAERFADVMKHIIGRRLSCEQLTGKVQSTQHG
jgi:hypothetical protein